jgi:hypothetical protein
MSASLPEPPRRPTRPLKPEESQQQQRSSLLSLVLAFGGGSLLLLVLFFLTLGYIGPVILVAGGVFAFAAFHWLLWGRWLSTSLRQEYEAEQARRKEER